MKINNDSQYREYKRAVEVLIEKGTKLGDMELLSDSDKEEFVRLTDAIYEWEAAYHPLPGKVSTIITDAIKKRMDAENIKQKKLRRNWAFQSLVSVSFYLGNGRLI